MKAVAVILQGAHRLYGAGAGLVAFGKASTEGQMVW